MSTAKMRICNGLKKVVAVLGLLGSQLAHTQTRADGPTVATDSLFPVHFPLDIQDLIRVSSSYGPRVHPLDHVRKFHSGIDLVAEKGKGIYATANGIANKVGYDPGYGNHIILSHWKGIKTLYGHLWVSLVYPGDSIRQGQLIGLVGDSGRVTGTHLHYELWYNDKKLDPMALWKHRAGKRQQP